MNRTFRFLGVMTRNFREGVSFILPTNRSEHKSPSVEDQIVEEPSQVKETVVAETKHPSFFDQESEMMFYPKPIKEGSFLQGIDFRNAGETLVAEIYIKDFRTGTPVIRKAALERIEQLPKRVSFEILKRLTRTEKDVVLQMEIVDALSRINNEGQLDKRFFIEYFKSDKTVLRLAAIRAFSKYGDDESFEILTKATEDAEPEVRRRALNAMVVTYEDRTIPLVLHALGDSDTSVRRMAAFSCGILKIKQSTSTLISMLNAPEVEVQIAANESLKKISGEDFGFNPKGAETSKKEAVAAWRFWSRDHHAS